MPSHVGAADLVLPPPPVLAEGIALFLDMDGVLAPMAPTPDAVKPVARRTAVLKALERRLDGRVAIVSGRTLAEIDRIADGALSSASGVHGLERRRRDGSIERGAADAGVTRALDAFHAFAAERPDQAGAAETLARELSDETGLALQPGHMVLELKTPGASKGTAVTAFMAEPPFRGATPVMLGDDVTDEDGFRAAAALGGYGVLVGAERATAARYRLDGVDAVLAWLESVAEA